MDKDTVKDALEDFKLCVDAESTGRKDALDDLEFALLAKQWPDDVKKQREREGRPCLTIPRLMTFIKQVTNDARQNRPTINVRPVGDGSDKDVARILRDLVRNIEAVSKADIAYDTGLDFAAYSGIGYWFVRDQYTCEDSFDKELIIERCANPLSVYGDYESKSATSDDWMRSFIVDLYTKASFKKKWPDADAADFDGDMSEEQALWFSEKRIQVAEWWTRERVMVELLQLTDGTVLYEDKFLEVDSEGYSLKDIMAAGGVTVKGTRKTDTYKVVQRIMSGCDVLETNEWKGKYIPIIPVYGNEFNVNGKRHFKGLIRDAKDAQRMFNYWRTASTELVALAPKAPWVGPVGAFATDPNWATANNATHQYLEFDIVPEAGAASAPQRQAFTGVPAGVLQEALSASQDMKDIMGLQDASLGKQSNETSGRAIMARQREGDVSTFNFADNRNRAIEHTGAILIDLIPKYYDAARIIRCLKEDGSSYSVPINQPAAPVQNQQQMPGQPQEEFAPAPEMIEGLTKVFDLTKGKYDVSVSAGPSYTTRRQEASESMMEFIRVLPQAGAVTGDLVAKAQDWPGAEEFAERLKAKTRWLCRCRSK
jgi:hypothetical protein